jgi:hypothetical protein
MDSHISKGNKKQLKQITEKKVYILEKYLQSSFFPLGFENYITQVVAVIRDALLKPFCKVCHHYLGHLWGNCGKVFEADVYKPRA